ncbi:LOW QUALITY PROTEIN: heme peroxidase [Jimgerdemannia flammicorona]|uniref:Heme peroxidase n=1 Tax=Jimgerdemannia flammicorona TaxID=994334 RepID=A0A433CX40_9FUNG|nr:LOW QUALITY PROTEIN: heme peroxidase [Jimgerdemannia flammicorona]
MIPSPPNGTILNCTDPLPQGYYPLARCISNIADSYRTPSSDFARRRQFKSLRKVSHMVSPSFYTLTSLMPATFFGQWLSFDIANSFATAEPNNISIPKDDYVYLSDNGSGFNGLSSLPFNRGNHQGVPGKVPTPRTGINTVTSFLDASPIYSDNNETLATLRDLGNRGKMKLVNNFPPKYGNLSYILGVAPHRSANVFTNMISTILLREHNRLCDVYYAKHGDAWTDEVYFQEARRWIIALLQKITITEYLGVILGSPLSDYTGYDASLAPGIEPNTNERPHSHITDTAILNPADITSDRKLLTKLETLYDNVNQVESLIGALSEDHVAGTNFGSLLEASMIKQSSLTVYHKRAFLASNSIRFGFTVVRYQSQRSILTDLKNPLPRYESPGLFTDDELAELRNTTWRDVIVRNLKEETGASIPRNVWFVQPATDLVTITNSTAVKYPNMLKLADIYHLYWHIDGTNIRIRINFQSDKGWFGIGFGSTDGGMTGADFVITTATNKSPNGTAVTVGEYFSTGYHPPEYDSKVQLIKVIRAEISNGMTIVEFMRPLLPTARGRANINNMANPCDSTDCQTSFRLTLPLNLASSMFKSFSHITLQAPFLRTLAVTEVLRRSIFYRERFTPRHRHRGNLLGCYTATVSIFIVRYMKHILNSYMTIHRNLQLVGGVTVSSMGAAAMATVDPAQRTPHAITGLVLYTIIFLHFGLGLSMWGQESLQSVNEGIPRAIKRIHRILGFCLLTVAWFNIYLGLDTYGSPEILEVFYLVWMGLLCATFISAEVYFRFFAHRVALRMAGLDGNENGWMLKDLINREVYDNLPLFSWNDVNEKVATGALLVVAERVVFDIREWVPVHPGMFKGNALN